MRAKLDIYVLLLSLIRFLCWWTISPGRYHTPSLWFGIKMNYSICVCLKHSVDKLRNLLQLQLISLMHRQHCFENSSLQV